MTCAGPPEDKQPEEVLATARGSLREALEAFPALRSEAARFQGLKTLSDVEKACDAVLPKINMIAKYAILTEYMRIVNAAAMFGGRRADLAHIHEYWSSYGARLVPRRFQEGTTCAPPAAAGAPQDSWPASGGRTEALDRTRGIVAARGINAGDFADADFAVVGGAAAAARRGGPCVPPLPGVLIGGRFRCAAEDRAARQARLGVTVRYEDIGERLMELRKIAWDFYGATALWSVPVDATYGAMSAVADGLRSGGDLKAAFLAAEILREIKARTSRAA